MAYDIWLSLKARDVLRYLKENDGDLNQEIWDKLNRLAVYREDFRTGPEKFESFIAGNKKVIYRVGHRIRAVDVTEIIELP